MIKLYNTLSRKIEEFKPLKKDVVGIYSCGPTVYWNQHLGHMYAYVQWDSLVRLLRVTGNEVKWVMNITDVGHLTSDEDTGEDKMERGAKREGISVWEIAEKYLKQFMESMELLNIQKPDVLCRATDHIPEQIELIKKIESNGFAYKTKTGLVFDTGKFPAYADFSRLNLEKQFAGARTEIDPEKKKPWDFLLWVTNQPEHVMQWDSPWGKGFPGWHIECTAMSTKYLGETFDIHTGGREHIPVHHTNEIAQGFGAFGHQTANFWLHNDWLIINGEKMSKSLGNNVLASDLKEKGFDPMALRYLILTSHYRQGLNFTWESLTAAQNALNNLREILRSWPFDGVYPARGGAQGKNMPDGLMEQSKLDADLFWQRFIEAASLDLGIPQALVVMWEMVRTGTPTFGTSAVLLEMDKILGLGLDKYLGQKLEIPEEVQKLINERENSRKSGDFKKSDELRNQIQNLGYEVEDTSSGSRLKKV